MNISIFGLGYVGAVTAGCLTQFGHRVVGADVQEAKVESFKQGISPIFEPELDTLLRKARQDGLLDATTSAEEAVSQSDVSIVCVGTPSLESGRLNLDFVRKVCSQLSEAIQKKSTSHVIILRSTMLPGSVRQMANDFFSELLSSGKVRIYYCPEFLREGTAVADFRTPSLSVIGTVDGEAPGSPEAQELMGGEPSILTWEGAEAIKYACNYFHALKVGFANEIGRLCKHLGEDGSKVMKVVCDDTKLNISSYYMKPGNPFGGSCLPKDVSALNAFARQEGINLPLLDNTLDTNQAHLDLLIRLVLGKEKRKIGILGLTFKADTDDLRGSPMVAIAEILLGRGYELSIYDPRLDLKNLIGANEQQIQRRMPHLAQLLKDKVEDVIQSSELVIASQRCVSVEELSKWVTFEQSVIDVNGWRELKSLPWNYEGLCW